MSILTKPYELSVWNDVWDQSGCFVEQLQGIIGSDTMQTKNKAFNVQLTRNVNGTKKLTFSLQKYYIDNYGERVENPFVDWLKNEKRVKLKYGQNDDGEDVLYDFVVKNIVENSADYTYKYTLADALVQELTKNGFNLEFSPELNNNLGTVEYLANKVLEETDWTVESEAVVERVEENLVYIMIPAGTNIVPIIDQSETDRGAGASIGASINLNEPTLALAFYSSCTSKPHRFQFIKIDGGYNKNNVFIDEDNVITNENCQFYFEVNCPEKFGEYVQSRDYPQFYVPKDWSIHISKQEQFDDTVDTTISSWYRGKRIGFLHSTEYVPLLKKYCNKYTKNGENYYGYVDNTYASPAFTQNVISNYEFKGTTGWVGTYIGFTPNAKPSFGATAESAYGKFSNNKFVSVVELLTNNLFSDEDTYSSYLKVTFPSKGAADYPVLINSGFYDNRATIRFVENNEEWYFDATILNDKGQKFPLTNFNIELREATYDPNTGSYKLTEKQWAEYDYFSKVLKFKNNVKLSEKEFQKKELRLIIHPIAEKDYNATYYIQNIELFKVVLVDQEDGSTKMMRPGDAEIAGALVTSFHFFPETDILNKKAIEDIIYDIVDKKAVDYSTYVPVYNSEAQKVRQIEAKESNYFNILQDIAETFEVWLELYTKIDENGVIQKVAKFKNYSGKNNDAAFRYGVNLKDIQRTHASQNIVTKLIVKQNTNELAPNGYCAISNAKANPTGEDIIYDFRYFHEMGALDPEKYLASLYYQTNPIDYTKPLGKDIDKDYEGECNLQNYFNRIKILNEKIKAENGILATVQNELVHYNAELEVQSGLKEAASAGIAEVEDDFIALTGLTPKSFSTETFSKVECFIPDADSESGVNTLNGNAWSKNAAIKKQQIGDVNSVEWKFDVSLSSKWTECGNVSVSPYAGENGSSWDGEILGGKGYAGLQVKHTYKNNTKYRLTYWIQQIDNAETEEDNEGELRFLGGHNGSFAANTIYVRDYSGVPNTGVLDPQKAKTYEISNSSRIAIDPTRGGPYEVIVYGTYIGKTVNHDSEFGELSDNCFFIQPNRGGEDEELTYVSCHVYDIKLEQYGIETSDKSRTIYIQPNFILTPKKLPDGTQPANQNRSVKIACTIPAYATSGSVTHSLAVVDTQAQNISNLLTEYATYKMEFKNAEAKLSGDLGLENVVKNKKEEVENRTKYIEKLIEYKKDLNLKFFSTYSRFIQEGTWISEEYVDNDKYYNDALSVMYHSCYPQVAYTINVITLSNMPGYELYDFNIGDITYAEDPDFFGKDGREKVVVNEMTNFLEDPSKDSIKVQNFKNQFQDLFQKITATVQQAQYRTGAYEKAAALADANNELKSSFVTDALGYTYSKLVMAGQTSVVQGADGITLTDEATKDQMRLIGGAILMSTEDKETGKRSWKTGLTPEGISASLITAGTINTGNISIMNGKDMTFKLDAFGLSAFDTDWSINGIYGTPNKNKFVRFDKHGIYGINDNEEFAVDGTTWRPSSMEEIDEKANFSLTWDGLKIVGDDNDNKIEAKIGWHTANEKDYIMRITHNGESIFDIGNDGTSHIAGWTIGSQRGYNGGLYHNVTGRDGKYRFGLKVEDGAQDRFAFYVKKFKEGQELTEKPAGELVFGVRYDGEVVATKGSIKGHVEASSGSFGDLEILATPFVAGGRPFSLRAKSEQYSGAADILYEGDVLFGSGGIFMSALGAYDDGEGLYLNDDGCYILMDYNSQGQRKTGFGNSAVYSVQYRKDGTEDQATSLYPDGIYFTSGTTGNTEPGLHYGYMEEGSSERNIYLVDEDGNRVKVADLVFKQGYIWSTSGGSHVMGTIAQIGPVVYGIIYNTNSESSRPVGDYGDATADSGPSGMTFSSSNETNLNDLTFPGPYGGVDHSISIYNVGDGKWYGRYHFFAGSDGKLWLHLGDYNDNLESIKTGSGYQGGIGSYGYFCYSANAAYHI